MAINPAARALTLLLTITLLMASGCDPGPRIDESNGRFTDSVKAAKRDLTPEEKEEFEAAWKILSMHRIGEGKFGERPDLQMGGALHGLTAREAIAKAKKIAPNFEKYMKKGPNFKGVQ